MFSASTLSTAGNLELELIEWLESRKLRQIEETLVSKGITNLKELVDSKYVLDLDSDIILDLENSIVVQQYFQEKGIEITFTRLHEMGITSLHALSQVNKDSLPYAIRDVISSLPKNPHWVDTYTARVLNKVDYKISNTMCAISLLCCLLIFWISMKKIPTIKKFIQHIYFPQCVSNVNCVIVWHWSDPAEVGTPVSFTVKFFNNYGEPYSVSDSDDLIVTVGKCSRQVNTTIELFGTDGLEQNCAKCSFIIREAGTYRIDVKIASLHVEGSPSEHVFVAGPPAVSKFQVIGDLSALIWVEGHCHEILVKPVDEFGNYCTFKDTASHIEKYDLQSITGNLSTVVSYDKIKGNVVFKFPELPGGFYSFFIKYDGSIVPPGELHVVVLTSDEMNFLDDSFQKVESKKFEVIRLLPKPDGTYTSSPVYCKITSRFLIIYDYFLGVVPKQIAKFKVSRKTKVSITNDTSPIISITSRSKSIYISNCRLVVALFRKFLLYHIGGSDKFEDKKKYFYCSVRSDRKTRITINLRINRHNIIESSLRATKHFSNKHWLRHIKINFFNEYGIDDGGPGREWIEILCKELFDSENQLFITFHNGSQGLVHPNHDRPSHLDLKYFKFAGIIFGKCLYESSIGLCPQSVRARFTRSFLCQILGLEPTYEHFRTDDPEYYNGFVKYLLENDPDTLDELYFVDEIILKNGSTVVKDLVPNGSKKRVTELNKHEYLEAMANYRLSKRVSNEMSAFISGLNILIPNSLLDMFDENELELLACGIDEYDKADFRMHHELSKENPIPSRVLNWFWKAVSNFSNEDMARLLQFTTGCSRLPVGGFKELFPLFKLSYMPYFGQLPSAHTCINMLCITDADDYETFEIRLRLAIREGCEGFGFE